ncbi:MAG: DUF488 domain-containing protein [Gordonia sp. (in: high G+C Gram-positive bacteria)]|uniref:DUF488 domain-containing protein n=1 Tax=Gordonia sp. (in: high G+C Gram-positive bacteria) TaxID=84139 RepID=UPI0039E42D80
MSAPVRIRRIYDEPSTDDGARVLVDRLWPRGISKERAALDEWCKTVAPSTELRRWYAHDPARFDEFDRRYRAELESGDDQTAGLAHLRELATDGVLTLLTATKDPALSEAEVLRRILTGG